MITKSHHIHTQDGSVRVGGVYWYEDSQARIKVEVVQDLSDREWVKLLLKQLPEGSRQVANWEPFVVRGLRGNFEYRSSWKLLDPNAAPAKA